MTNGHSAQKINGWRPPLRGMNAVYSLQGGRWWVWLWCGGCRASCSLHSCGGERCNDCTFEVFAVNPESTIAHEEAGGELLPRIVADVVMLETLPCVVMAFVAFSAGRTCTSRPQPVVTRKRKRNRDDADAVVVRADHGIGTTTNHRGNEQCRLFAPLCEQCGGQFTKYARTGKPLRNRVARLVVCDSCKSYRRRHGHFRVKEDA